MKSFIIRSLAVTCLLLLMTSSYAHTLSVVADSFADESRATTITNDESLDKRRLLLVDLASNDGDFGAGERQVFLQYELDSLPDNITSEAIDKATLRLWVSHVQAGGQISVHRVLEPWKESALKWNDRPSIEALPSAVFTIDESAALTWQLVDITKLMQTWVNIPENNHGLVLKAVIGTNVFVEFGSKEGIAINDSKAIDARTTSRTGCVQSVNSDSRTACPPTTDPGDGDGDDGDGDTVAITGPLTHPSEIEIVQNQREFDLLGTAANELLGQEQGIYTYETVIKAQLDLNTPRFVMYHGTISMTWDQPGSFTASCRGLLFENDQIKSITPDFMQSVSGNSRSHTFSIMGSSEIYTLTEAVRAEINCYLLTEYGDLVEHSTNGNIHLWSTNANAQ